MEIKRIPIEKVENWDKNPKTGKTQNFERLKQQILILGIYKPLICFEEKGKFITLGGNSRLMALRELAHPEVDISIIHPKDEAEKLMYAMSDNDRVTDWDEQALAERLYETKDKFPFDIFRIDIGNTISVENLLTQYGPRIDMVGEDEVPKSEATAITEFGDIFELGPHRLLCGDSTQPDSYKALLEGAKADMIFTDPPWNVAYEGTKFKQIMNDDMDEESYVNFTVEFMKRLQENTKPGGVFYICGAYANFPILRYAIKAAGLIFTCAIIWVKNQTAFGWEDYKKKQEMVLKAKNSKKKAQPILYGWNKGRHYFAKDKIDADVWEMPRRASTTMLHPTQKPLGLVQKAIKNSSRPNEIILDIFGGSGSTLVGSEREGRIARIMELDPIFCDTIIRRYAALGAFTEDEIRATKRKMEFNRKIPVKERKEK